THVTSRGNSIAFNTLRTFFFNINPKNNRRRSTNESNPSKLTSFLEFCGYGASTQRESQSRTRPTGSNLFAIQDVPPVAFRSSRSENRTNSFDNLN
ncbi:9410_t:CDS:1, partial [Entrophospora sp. SA101]